MGKKKQISLFPFRIKPTTTNETKKENENLKSALGTFFLGTPRTSQSDLLNSLQK